MVLEPQPQHSVGRPSTRNLVESSGARSESSWATRARAPSLAEITSSCGAISLHGPHLAVAKARAKVRVEVRVEVMVRERGGGHSRPGKS